MNDYETAGGRERSSSPFPREWLAGGEPPADMDERSGWIKAKIFCGRVARAHGEEVRWLREGGTSTARRIAQLRLRILDVRARQ